MPSTTEAITISPRNQQALASTTTKLSALINKQKVTNHTECMNARDLLGRVIEAKKRASTFIKPLVEQAKKMLSTAKEKEAELLVPLNDLETVVRGKINLYLTSIEEKKREEERKQEDLRRQHEEKVAASKRPSQIKPLPAPKPIITPPVMENTAVPMIPKYEITNENEIPEKYWTRMLNRGMIWDEIRAAHKAGKIGEIDIPGVRAWEESSIRINNK